MTTGRLWRAYAPTIPGTGALVELSQEESHHLARVLRLRAGDDLAVFDGQGREFLATLASTGRRVSVKVGEPVRGRTDPRLAVTLWQGLCRPERMDWVVQKATEIGAAAVVPFRAGRSETGGAAKPRLERWRRIALEAAKQSGRRVVPRLGDVVSLPPSPPEGVEALFLHPGSEPIALRLAGPRPGALWVAAGPEGGFTDSEARQLAGAGWTACSLGPRTLRAETAGPIALALALFAWDDLGAAGAEWREVDSPGTAP